MIEITVNGALHRLQDSLTVATLLDHLELTGKRLAVEMDGEIVPKSRHADTPILDGARLEIVIAVGGG